MKYATEIFPNLHMGCTMKYSLKVATMSISKLRVFIFQCFAGIFFGFALPEMFVFRLMALNCVMTNNEDLSDFVSENRISCQIWD